MKTITLLPGDGIGPEVTAAAVRVLEAAGARYEWESHAAGAEVLASGVRTRDLGGEASTNQFTEAIVREIERG